MHASLEKIIKALSFEQSSKASIGMWVCSVPCLQKQLRFTAEVLSFCM